MGEYECLKSRPRPRNVTSPENGRSFGERKDSRTLAYNGCIAAAMHLADGECLLNYSE